MRQKVLICAALLGSPEILILDEPLSGLDVTAARVLRDLMRELTRRGRIVLYSSHVLEVVERICSRVIILHKGHVVADDSVERLREWTRAPDLDAVFSQLTREEDTAETARQIAEAISA